MICIPICKKTAKGALEAFKKAKKEADVVEVWFDEIKSPSDKELAEFFKTKTSIIYKYQGGEALERVLEYKPSYVDIDLETPKAVISKIKKLSPKTKIIISHHDFKETPELKKINSIAKRMKQKGADIIKIATMANKITDSIKMLSFLSQQKNKAIIVCMGKEGRITRTTGHLFGNYLMYASLSAKESTAEGQITVSEFKKIINNY